MRLADLVGLVALATLLGTLAACHWLVVPLLHEAQLVDANLARALAEPLELRVAELALAGACLAALVSPWWIEHRLGSTLALLTAAGAAIHRFVSLPLAQQAWSKVDLVTGRPSERYQAALDAQAHDGWLVLLVVLGGLGLAVGASLRRWTRVAAADAAPEHPAAASEPGTSDASPAAPVMAAPAVELGPPAGQAPVGAAA